jgi:hypothetical protein
MHTAMRALRMMWTRSRLDDGDDEYDGDYSVALAAVNGDRLNAIRYPVDGETGAEHH